HHCDQRHEEGVLDQAGPPFVPRELRSQVRPDEREVHVGLDYWRLEPTLLNLLEALLPTKAMATMQITAIRATSSAYSTRLAPRSLRPSLARTKGAMCCCQY